MKSDAEVSPVCDRYGLVTDVADVEVREGGWEIPSDVLVAVRSCLRIGAGSFRMSWSNSDIQLGGDMLLGLQHHHTACASNEKPRTRSTYIY